MPYPEVIIPPWVQPVSPTEPQLLDDQSIVFSPRFGRGVSQRQVWGDPIWGWKVRFQGLSQSSRAALLRAVIAARGKAANIRMTPGIPIRGSFPNAELLTNNDFSNALIGWTSTSGTYQLLDRVVRSTTDRNSAGSVRLNHITVVTVQYASYCARAMFYAGVGHTNYICYYSDGFTADASTSGPGLRTIRKTGSTTIADISALEFDTPGFRAGDYFDVPYMSLSRCALVDNAPNAMLHSRSLNNGSWTLSGAAISADSDIAPDGTSTADRLVEDTSSGSHYVLQLSTRVSGSADLCAWAFVKQIALDRDIRLEATNDAGADKAICVFDLSAGTALTPSTIGAATNPRAFMKSVGAGWYFCAIVANLPSSSSISSLVLIVRGSDGSQSYTGTTGSVAVWDVGAAVSSVPTRGGTTTSSGTTGTAQLGNAVYLKGLPASTDGLLLSGDFFELNGELKRCTAPLNSDALGLGHVQFSPGLAAPPADNDPVIINNPMGRFTLASDPKITEDYGIYTSFELDLVESYT